MEDVELIVPIKMALSPKVRNWVLFSNGTIAVIDDITKEALSNLSTMGHQRRYVQSNYLFR